MTFHQTTQSIIIMYHKNRELLKYSLSTLLPTIPKEVEIIIVANNQISEEITITVDNPNVKVLYIQENLLYSEAANRGVAEASGEIITLCDQDIFYEKNWYVNLYRFFTSSPQIGAVSPKLLNPHNNRIIDFGIAYSEQTIAHPTRGFQSVSPWTQGNYKVLSACGAVLMTTKQLYQEVGGMDITMPYICCDCDYGIQLKKRNLETWIVGSSVVYHIGSSSSFNTKISSYEYMRADSKAMFFAKDYADIPHDLIKWMEKMTVAYRKNYSLAKRYYLFNFSTVSDKMWYVSALKDCLSISFYDIYHISVPSKTDKLSLYNLMPMSMLNVKEPIIYFVDSFLLLFDNFYWWENRNYQNDIIVDRNGTIISVADVVHQRI